MCVCVGHVAVGKQHTGIGWLQRNNLQYHHHHHLHQKQQQRHNSCDCPCNHHYLIIVDIIFSQAPLSLDILHESVIVGHRPDHMEAWSSINYIVIVMLANVSQQESNLVKFNHITWSSMQPINKLLYNEYIIYDDIKYAIRVCNYPYAPTCFKHFNGTASKGLSDQILPPGTLQQYQESMDPSGSKLFLSPA